MADIKKVGISKIRPLNEGEEVCCERCGVTETKMVQGYTRKVTCQDDDEIKVLHYIDQEVCVNCGDKTDLVIWNNTTDEEVDGDVYVYIDLLDTPSREQQLENALNAIVNHPDANKMFEWAYDGIAIKGTPGRDIDTNELHEENGGLIAVFYNTQGAHHAAHAINEHDGMVDGLADRGKASFFSGLAVALQSIALFDEPGMAESIVEGLGSEVDEFAEYMKDEGGVDAETLEWMQRNGVVKGGEDSDFVIVGNKISCKDGGTVGGMVDRTVVVSESSGDAVGSLSERMPSERGLSNW